MVNQEEIPIPWHMFGDNASRYINAEDSITYSLSIYPLHFLPSKKRMADQVEASKSSVTYAHNLDMWKFTDKIKKHNAWQNTKKAYVKDAKHTYKQGVSKTVKQAFGF